MSIQIESDHLMNLADGQLLYNDLRNRINVATVAETMEIITEYRKQEDDDEMLIETEWYDNGSGDVGFATILDADEIAAFVKAGKSIMFHLPSTADSRVYCGGNGDGYLQLIEYKDAYEGTISSPQTFCIVGSNVLYDYNASPYSSMFTEVSINQSGKLCFKVYVD